MGETLGFFFGFCGASCLAFCLRNDSTIDVHILSTRLCMNTIPYPWLYLLHFT
jgi:hypothetical protein